MIRGLSVLAIIPARGGSIGIPRKNVRPIAGKPMLAYCIEQARATDSVDRVVVSTDNAEINDVALEYGAEVIKRPDALSGPKSSSESALIHVLDTLRETEGYEPDILVFLQATSPLTLAEDIEGTIRAMLDNRAQSALAVVPFHYFLWGSDSRGGAVGINHDKSVRLMRQDREPQFLESGAIYVMEVPGFRRAGHRFFGETAMYVMPDHRRFEIDEPVDLEVVDFLIRHRDRDARRTLLPERVEAVVYDFDGVLTDNRVTVSEDGIESVTCDRGDGLAIAMLREEGVEQLVLSKELNKVVSTRCRKLRIPVIQGQEIKWPVLRQWLDEKGISRAGTIYVGNDINDVECLQNVGCGVAVGDAHPAIRPFARLVLEKPGGRGAVRELADLILGIPERLDAGICFASSSRCGPTLTE
jgi:N-acylneuraminate cytidylyltransferase